MKNLPNQKVETPKDTGETVKQNSDVITIDLSEFLTPLSILLGAIIISVSIYFSLRNVNFAANQITPGDGTVAGTADDKPIAEVLSGFASQLNLKASDFDTCYASGKFNDEISKDSSDAAAVGIGGTPGFVVGKLANDGSVDGVLIPGAFPIEYFDRYMAQLKKSGKLTISDDDKNEGLQLIKTTIDDDPVLGDRSKAKYAIVEFSDYQCPYCQRHWSQTHPSIKSNYIDKGDTILVYRDLPLSFHPNANPAAIAANCAREQGGDDMYYKYHDLIFSVGI